MEKGFCKDESFITFACTETTEGKMLDQMGGLALCALEVAALPTCSTISFLNASCFIICCLNGQVK